MDIKIILGVVIAFVVIIFLLSFRKKNTGEDNAVQESKEVKKEVEASNNDGQIIEREVDDLDDERIKEVLRHHPPFVENMFEILLPLDKKKAFVKMEFSEQMEFIRNYMDNMSDEEKAFLNNMNQFDKEKRLQEQRRKKAQNSVLFFLHFCKENVSPFNCI